jgi:hypothetical protein
MQYTQNRCNAAAAAATGAVQTARTLLLPADPVEPLSL